TCSAKVRTPLNSPLPLGAKENLSSGMASAAPVNSPSAMLRMALSASPGVFAGGGAAICPDANTEPQITSTTANPNFALRINNSPKSNFSSPINLALQQAPILTLLQ